MQKHVAYVLILGVILVICWLLFDFILVKEEIFNKVEEFSFEDKNEVEIKEKIKTEISRYQSAEEAAHQILALVNMLECNYYLLFNRHIGLNRYYDFIKIILFPPQRKQLKAKGNYVDEVKRYLKRRRKIKLEYNKYEISYPVIPGLHEKQRITKVLVARTLDSGKDKKFLKYCFKQYNDKRYYLYFKKDR